MKLNIIRLIVFALFLTKFASGVAKNTLSSTENNESACLVITTHHSSYKESVSLITYLPVVKKWSSSLNAQTKMATGGDATDKTEFVKGNCYWSISLYESQATQLHLWKIFRVNVNSKRIFIMDNDGDYLPLRWTIQ